LAGGAIAAQLEGSKKFMKVRCGEAGFIGSCVDATQLARGDFGCWRAAKSSYR
jgi:hypothetical protein